MLYPAIQSASYHIYRDNLKIFSAN